mmetsp:Transcript_26036/g.82279  ORF Transcript_26036/g.82279 Transcript_26036/m.82279 type:complete len:238 (+) Transcript_26036:231-944(+)
MLLQRIVQGEENTLVLVPQAPGLDVERGKGVRRHVHAGISSPPPGQLQGLLCTFSLRPLGLDVLPQHVPRRLELLDVHLQLLHVGLEFLVALDVLLLLTFELCQLLVLFVEDVIRSAGLVLKHLLFLAFTLVLLVGCHKIFLVLLVARDEVGQRVFKGANLAFHAPDLVVQLITFTLQFLLFLRSLDHVVGLAGLLLSIFFFDLVHHFLVLALEVVNLLLALGQFYGSLVPLLLDPA